ncbi:MAG: hypothetical protein LQ340_004172 [Diploschistes diacapsis]|nr:MAG: hypothetical protein LQ340_004172 [Diploschistes diacapsis]
MPARETDMKPLFEKLNQVTDLVFGALIQRIDETYQVMLLETLDNETKSILERFDVPLLAVLPSSRAMSGRLKTANQLRSGFK